MSLPVSLKVALRELRGGFGGFRVFLACLILGVAAIAAVGSVRRSIEAALLDNGAAILGGDAELTLTYRSAKPDERRWMERHAVRVSEVVAFRSMVVVDRDNGAVRALTEVKAVDAVYPLFGDVALDPAMSLGQALAGRDGIPGAVMHPVLAARLGLKAGDAFRLGTQKFRLSALLKKEPDAAGDGFSLGPRTIVGTRDLADSGLLGPGSLYETRYRLELGGRTRLRALEKRAKKRFEGKGMHWHDRRNGAPGMKFFVERIGSFLVLIGLAGLAVGGIGIATAIRAYLATKTGVIATLKTLGATSGVIFRIYFTQIACLSVVGIGLGLGLGAALPFALVPMIGDRLSLSVPVFVYPSALIEAAIYGFLTAILFTLWPLARTRAVRPATLFRDGAARLSLRVVWPYLLAMGASIALLLLAAYAYAAVPGLALWTFGAIGAAMLVLLGVALALGHGAMRLARWRRVRGRPALRLALAAVGSKRSEAVPVVLSLGLGLAVLAAVGQIDWNLRAAIGSQLPRVAPTFFFIDIQNDQIDGFRQRTTADPAISRVQTSPMLRGIISRIKGRPAREIAGDHWVVTGDRGVTFAASMPQGTKLTAGKWWPADYAGPPLVSFAEEEAREIGLDVGDTLTVNILGRDIEATIASLRVVDFSTAGIGFVLAMNPSAVAGAPHTHIATVYMAPGAEAELLRDVGTAWPNITAIRVREAIERVAGVLRSLAAATSVAALATLLTGFVVLVGASAAGEQARTYEAAILSTLGASKGRILWSFTLRAALMGAAAGLVAITAGGLAGWAVMRFVMDGAYMFEPVSAVAVVGGGALVTVLAGLLFALRPLASPPAQVLRARE